MLSLRLYVSGNAPQSIRAILNIKRICEQYLKGDYELDIIDIYKNSVLARTEQVIATPTLTLKINGVTSRLIGDLSDEKKVLKGLKIYTTTNFEKSNQKKKAEGE